MKKVFVKLAAVSFYLVILLYSVGFQIASLWNVKEVALVFFGAFLLTFAGYKKGMRVSDLRGAAASNALIAAYLTTFIDLFTGMMTADSSNIEPLTLIALNCRPLLYGFVIYIVLKPEKKAEEKGEEEKREPEELFRQKGLTSRETEIAMLVRSGLSNREIGEKLYISETTVKKHVSNLFEKLEITNREQLKQL